MLLIKSWQYSPKKSNYCLLFIEPRSNEMNLQIIVVYEYSSSHIWGGAVKGCYQKWSRATAQPEVTSNGWKWRQSPEPEVCSAQAQLEVMQYRPSGYFWPEVTSVTWLPAVMFCACLAFSRGVFLTRVALQFWSEVRSDWRHRKRPCPEVCSAHARFSPRFLSLVVVQ